MNFKILKFCNVEKPNPGIVDEKDVSFCLIYDVLINTNIYTCKYLNIYVNKRRSVQYPKLTEVYTIRG